MSTLCKTEANEVAVYAQVALGFALDKQFDYLVPDDCHSKIQVGMRVLVPFGPRRTMGYVTALKSKCSFSGKVKPIAEVLDEAPTFTLSLLEFLRWTSTYYQVPLGELMRKALPPSLHETEKRRVFLTEEGRNCVQQEPMLERFQAVRGVTLRRALEFCARKELDILVERNLVTVTASVEAGGARERYVRMVHIDVLDADKITGPKQKLLVDYVWKNGPLTTAELKHSFKGVDRLLRLLVERQVLRIELRRDFRTPESEYPAPRIVENLNVKQEEVASFLRTAIADRCFKAVLLHGVTGSGKTEVYIRALRATLDSGRNGLVLVPEIALTPQLMAVFSQCFGEDVAILHSALSPGERYDQWSRIAAGSCRIVVGARSAIFAPLENLGLVIVDEEHEPSFKQDERPFYNARDLALVRARLCQALALLGSATPSVESYSNALSGKYTLLSLPYRATPKPLPDITIVDLKEVLFADSDRIISRPFADALEANLEEGHQSMCFLNRKGFASFLLCEACGAVPRCSQCDISLTYYKRSNSLRCHYCHFGGPVPDVCPTCSTSGLKQIGFGTERVVEVLTRLLPTARIERLDSTVTGGSRLTKTLSAFRRRDIDILVGTQIIAKGHDFPGVTLVGALCADMGLSFPDFRASERTFQLLTQVAGRAGRGTQPGRVFIQTWLPEHTALAMAQRQDFTGFAKGELEQRRMRRYPPYTALALLRFSAPELARAEEAASRARVFVEARAGKYPSGQVELLGPSRAPISYLRNRFRMQLLVRADSRATIQAIFRNTGGLLYERIGRSGGLRWSLDIDPVNLM